MPNFKTTTKEAKESWKSDDGKVTIYEVVMDYNGKPLKTQTMSKAIATVGWSGEVETYENAKGRTYIRQPKTEGNWGGSKNYTPRDDSAIKAQFAIKAAVNLAASGVIPVDDIEPTALDFFDMVERVKGDGAKEEVKEVVETKEDDEWTNQLEL